MSGSGRVQAPSASQSTPSTPATSSRQASAGTRLDERRRLLQQLGLTVDRILSDDGDSFATLACRDHAGERMVLKYIQSGSPDAYRRLSNETRLLKALPVSHPLRTLTVHASARGYLLTGFDDGVLLGETFMEDDRVVASVAEALVTFQSASVDSAAIGVAPRERLPTYYLKVLVKHLAHLWPSWLSAREAVQCLSVVTRSLPAILRTPVICHGDFLPTNLLFHQESGAVTFTDFEGFMQANHPLFDVLALCTITDRDLREWHWQTKFLSRYLEHARRLIGLDPRTPAFRVAYRGILVFFLAYRLNEGRLLEMGAAYFDGLGKRQFLFQALRHAVSPGRGGSQADAPSAALAIRANNLRLALDPRGFERHFDLLLAGA